MISGSVGCLSASRSRAGSPDGGPNGLQKHSTVAASDHFGTARVLLSTRTQTGADGMDEPDDLARAGSARSGWRKVAPAVAECAGMGIG